MVHPNDTTHIYAVKDKKIFRKPKELRDNRSRRDV